jgi:hypothetical protein
MLVIRSVMGTKKTVVFVSLVVIMATLSGLIFKNRGFCQSRSDHGNAKRAYFRVHILK